MFLILVLFRNSQFRCHFHCRHPQLCSHSKLHCRDFHIFGLTHEQYSEHGLKLLLHLQASDLHSDLEQSHSRLFVTASRAVLAQGGIMMAFNSKFR